MPGEDDVGCGRGELPALGGVAGLDDDRVALRGARDGELALDGEVPAVVGDGARGSVGGPGVPQLAGGGDELGGAGVPLGPVQAAAAPEVLAGEGVGGGDGVPGGPAGAEVVEGGEPAGRFVGLVEGGVDGGGETEPVGDGRERGEHGQRLGPADHVQVVDEPLVLAQPQPLGEEEEVEQPPLGRAREVFERGELDLAAGARVGPDGGVVHAGEVRGEVHLFRDPLRGGGRHTRSPARAYRLAGRARPRCSRRVPPG